MTLQTVKVKIVPILKKAGVKRSAIFGSVARGEAKKNSDLDLLVEMKKSSTLFDFVGLKQELEETLGQKVDLVSFAAVHPKLKTFIERDLVKIL